MSESSSAPEIQDTPADQPAPDLESQETTQADTAPEPIDPFDEAFDSATLPDELRPGWKQLQASYTQKTQSLAEQRKELEHAQALLEHLQSDDPEDQALALRALGYDLEDLEDEEGYEDDGEYDDEDNEVAELRKQLEEINEWRNSQQQQEQEQEYEELMNQHLDESWDDLRKQVGRDDFDEQEEEVLERLAVAYPDEDGLPSLHNAYEALYSGVLPKAKQRYFQRKQPTPAPGSGSAGTPQVDLSDDNARIAAMARAIEAGGD